MPLQYVHIQLVHILKLHLHDDLDNLKFFSYNLVYAPFLMVIIILTVSRLAIGISLNERVPTVPIYRDVRHNLINKTGPSRRVALMPPRS